jgi:hypothetical protein
MALDVLVIDLIEFNELNLIFDLPECHNIGNLRGIDYYYVIFND